MIILLLLLNILFIFVSDLYSARYIFLTGDEFNILIIIKQCRTL